jgi:hypothetical protein
MLPGDWPRNGAFVKGLVCRLPDEQQWLQVSRIRQAGKGTREWKTVAHRNLWLPFEGGDFNGGRCKCTRLLLRGPLHSVCEASCSSTTDFAHTPHALDLSGFSEAVLTACRASPHRGDGSAGYTLDDDTVGLAYRPP